MIWVGPYGLVATFLREAKEAGEGIGLGPTVAFTLISNVVASQEHWLNIFRLKSEQKGTNVGYVGGLIGGTDVVAYCLYARHTQVANQLESMAARGNR